MERKPAGKARKPANRPTRINRFSLAKIVEIDNPSPIRQAQSRPKSGRRRRLCPSPPRPAPTSSIGKASLVGVDRERAEGNLPRPHSSLVAPTLLLTRTAPLNSQQSSTPPRRRPWFLVGFLCHWL
ncbi:unnamed protein product [Urochloa humidicola]